LQGININPFVNPNLGDKKHINIQIYIKKFILGDRLMKRSIFLISGIVLASVLLSTAVAANDISGTWNGKCKVLTLRSFKQAGSNINRKSSIVEYTDVTKIQQNGNFLFLQMAFKIPENKKIAHVPDKNFTDRGHTRAFALMKDNTKFYGAYLNENKYLMGIVKSDHIKIMYFESNRPNPIVGTCELSR